MAKKKLPISGYDYVMPKPDAETIRKSIVYKLIFILGVDPKEATSHQWLNAAMLAARDLIAEDFLKTRRATSTTANAWFITCPWNSCSAVRLSTR